ncbi:sigma 54-interacting transcriptional regulator [Neptunicella sp.]|uniref:sigma 54-interacting transcriptional regulator n=1 Tax=Neptunicella sp. TaxID=2125986 RepID=UPI003F68E2CB
MTNKNARILLVDDDPSLLRLLSLRLEGEGYQVSTAVDGEQALRSLNDNVFDLVLSDLRMPGMDGMALFDEVVRKHAGVPVIIMTAHGSIAEAVTATQSGVHGFLTKPIDHDELRKTIDAALKVSHIANSDSWREKIITRSQVMENVLEQAYRVAQRDVSILLTGASGTGKELMARAIHNASPRKDHPFIAVNCGAIPENLLESELFGHAKGAFTGAIQDHQGLFQQADKGTLLLDEIGDMPLHLQVKLLRALQEQQIRPVGSSKHIAIDVRIISATHRDIDAAMKEGQFREDLYYRLNVVNLHLPGLHERAEDIPVLARHLLQTSAKRHGVKVSRFSDDAMQMLTTAPWPGNVRQLVNVVEQCVALTQSPMIGLHMVEQALSESSCIWPTLSDARDAFERQYLLKVLKMADGNVTRAADLAGRNRTDLHKLMKKHHLNTADIKAQSE